MPQGLYLNVSCKSDGRKGSKSHYWHPKFTPQLHQKFLLSYFMSIIKRDDTKGILLYHKLGSGKTCSSIIIADTLLSLEDGLINTIYIMSSGSLRQGWITEYCGVCGDNEEYLTKKYRFLTLNYGGVLKMLPNTFDNCLVVIDEVHNFVNSVKNISKTAMAIYTIIKRSKCKILALSGTPIYNNIFEWSILGNLLKPGAFPDIIVMNKKGYDEIHKELFMDLFSITDDNQVIPKDPQKFKDSLAGIVSYFPGATKEFYPEVIEEPIVKAVMNSFQQSVVVDSIKTENSFITKGPPSKHLLYTAPAKYYYLKSMYILASKRIISRRPSNFVYPVGLSIKKPEEVPSEVKLVDAPITEDTRIEDLSEQDLKLPPDDVAPDGWLEPSYFDQGQLEKQYSTKIFKLINNILNNFHSKHVVFSFFKEHYGVKLIQAIFKMCGLANTVAFTGDLTDAKRNAILKRYNSVENRYGNLIKILFLTDAGAEGITLLETGHIHILESDPRENKIQQVIGRTVRYKSHINMPKKEQVVHIWRYWSTYLDSEEPGIDELLYNKGQSKMNMINSFLKLLIDNSIEQLL